MTIGTFEESELRSRKEDGLLRREIESSKLPSQLLRTDKPSLRHTDPNKLAACLY